MLNEIKDEIEKGMDKDMPRKKSMIISGITIILAIVSIILAIKFDFVDSLLITELIIPLGIVIMVALAFWIHKKIYEQRYKK